MRYGNKERVRAILLNIEALEAEIEDLSGVYLVVLKEKVDKTSHPHVAGIVDEVYVESDSRHKYGKFFRAAIDNIIASINNKINDLKAELQGL